MSIQAQHEALVRAHPWITTYTGKRITLPYIRVADVCMVDIAHSVALQARYLGHTDRFYSIAEHLILVSKMAEVGGEDALTVRAAFLHDAHEAYLGDFPSPFKQSIPGLKAFEHEIESRVLEAFDLPPKNYEVWAKVKRYDVMALHFEAQAMLRSPGWVQPEILASVPHDMRIAIHGYSPELAERMLMNRAVDLGIVRRS